MRLPAPPPASAIRTIVRDGYQLCHRCGQVLVNGDKSIVAFRGRDWAVFTHARVCVAQAARDWQAIRRAEDIAASDNVNLPATLGNLQAALAVDKREQSFARAIWRFTFGDVDAVQLDELPAYSREMDGVQFLATSVLDLRHIASQLRLATGTWQYEGTITAKLDGEAVGLEDLLEQVPAYDPDLGRHTVVERLHDDSEGDTILYSKSPVLRHNTSELEMIHLLSTGRPVREQLAPIYEERRRTYLVTKAAISDSPLMLHYPAQDLCTQSITRSYPMSKLQPQSKSQVVEMQHTLAQRRRVSLAEARQFQAQGVLVWWRPEADLPEREQYALVPVDVEIAEAGVENKRCA